MTSIVAFVFAVAASGAAVVFGVLTFSNPYSDITKAYTTLAFLASLVVAVTCWVMFGVVEERRSPSPEDDWARVPRL